MVYRHPAAFSGSADFDPLTGYNRCNVSYSGGQRECMDADLDDCVQHFLRRNFIQIPLLGRSADLSWYDAARVRLVCDGLTEKSIR